MAGHHHRKRDGFSWTRREFLIASGGAALSSATSAVSAVAGAAGGHGVRFTLFRSKDLLKWEVFSDGLRVDANPYSGRLSLRPITSGGTPIIQVGLGAQHLLEEVIPEDTTGSTIPRRGQLHAMSAEPTILAFRWPSALRELPLTDKDLQKIFGFECIYQGAGITSRIEAVTGIYLTPAFPSKSHWVLNSAEPTDGVNPLWTAEMATDSPPSQMWVAGSRPTGFKFIAAVTDEDRNLISDAFSGATPKCAKNAPDAIVPAPRVNQLVLSSQGAWLDVRAAWDPVGGCSLAEWNETITQRRTHFAEVVFKVWLYPDGIPVLLVLQTTRELENYSGTDFGDGVGAYLKKRLIIRPTKKSKLASAEDVFESPFTEVVVPAEGIPMLDVDKNFGNLPALPLDAKEFVIGGPPKKGLELGDIAFWPLVGGKPLKLRLLVRDHSGGEPREMVRSFIVVGNGLMEPDGTGGTRLKSGAGYEKKLDNEWESHPERHVDMGAVPWAVAKERVQADTSLTLRQVDMVRGARRGVERPFYSRTHSLGAILDVSRALTGSPTESDFTYRKKYLPLPADGRADTNGLLDPDTAPGGAFVRVFANQSTTLEIAKGAQRNLGAVSSPSGNIAGVGRDHGLVLGHPDLPPAPSLDEIFPHTAQLLGGFLLKDILASAGEIPGWEFNIGLPEEAEIGTETSPNDEEPLIDGWIASFAWSTDKLKSSGFFGSDSAELTILADVGSKFSNGQAFWNSKGLLTSFFIAFPSHDSPMFRVNLAELRFEAGTNEPPRITVEVTGVEFAGLLELLKKLKDLLKIPSDLHVDVSANAVNVTYEIKKKDPSEVLGLIISDLRLVTGLSLSLRGDPLEIILGVSKRDQPFTISSQNGYSGAGYLEIRAHSDTIFFFAFSIEVGASWKKNFGGIAKGGVTLMVGFYFQKDKDAVGLKAYVRMQGFLNIAGIGGLDITAYIGLSWDAKCPNTFQGVCEVKVSVHIGPLEVSKSFEASHSMGADCQAQLAADLRPMLSLEEFCEACP